MTFSIVYWNIWLDNQLNEDRCRASIIPDLEAMIARYKPTSFGLCELLTRRDDGSSEVLKCLQKHGYVYQALAPAADWDDVWCIGEVIASRVPLRDTLFTPLGAHFSNQGLDITHDRFAVSARVDMGASRPFTVTVAHLLHLAPSALNVHYRHQQVLRQLVQKYADTGDIIVGGDFNEPRLFPFSFASRTRQRLVGKTGTVLRPTWHFEAWHSMKLGMNLDKIFWTKDSGLRLIRFRLLPYESSDHLPLYAEFEIASPQENNDHE